ncbi:MAG TPA: OmpH family outer membrane protein [Spirochaetota bacterium]|nr:OmpH family outer membrane protein [Spirochaetota bacterium]
MRPVYAIILAAAIASSCGKARLADESEARIRSVNMALLFEYAVNSDPDARGVKAAKTEALSAVRTLKARTMSADRSESEPAERELGRRNAELEKLNAAEEQHRQRILAEINRAMNAVASRQGIDFILGAGEGAVYSGKEYDITEEVLREMAALRKRNAPVSR